MARLTSRDGRSRIPVLVLAAVVIAALAVGAYLIRRTTGPSTPAAPTVTSTDPTVAADDDDAAPTGCLSGPARTTAMVLTAQHRAPHTTFGAVEVAAALMRWGLRYPYPTRADVRALRPALSPTTADTQEANLLKEYGTAYRSLPGVTAPDGTAYYVTTANGDWLVTPDSTVDRITVQLEGHPVVDGAYRTSRIGLAADMRWGSSGWQLYALGRADPVALTNGATTFTSGC